tara:strand:- start:1 stop:150 length:150 start_codon:yes stop_codon:yes gene_type:complete
LEKVQVVPVEIIKMTALVDQVVKTDKMALVEHTAVADQVGCIAVTLLQV